MARKSINDTFKVALGVLLGLFIIFVFIAWIGGS